MTTPIGNDRYLTDMDIRIWLRDNDPAANKLIDDLEFSPEELRTAITLAVDFYNERPPIIQCYEYTDFPYRFHLLKGTAANLLFIAANLYRRNKLTYNIPGGAVGDQDRAPDYDAAGQKLWEEYVKWVDMIKRFKNAEMGWGTVG
jgi:hypothetical protein